MSPKEICRICIQECDSDYTEPIDLNKLQEVCQFFEILHLEHVQEQTCLQDHVICSTCINNFKSLRTLSMNVHQSNSVVEKLKSVTGLNNITSSDLGEAVAIPTLQNGSHICRVCLKPTEVVAVHLYDNPNNILPPKFVEEMLKSFGFTLAHLELTVAPVLCYQCWQRLQVTFAFQKQSALVTSKIKFYQYLLEKNNLGVSDLGDIVHMWDQLGSENISYSPFTKGAKNSEMPLLRPEVVEVEDHYYYKKSALDHFDEETDSAISDEEMPVLEPAVNCNLKTWVPPGSTTPRRVNILSNHAIENKEKRPRRQIVGEFENTTDLLILTREEVLEKEHANFIKKKARGRPRKVKRLSATAENKPVRFFEHGSAANEEILKYKHMKRGPGRPPKIKPRSIIADLPNSQSSRKDHIENQNGVEPFSVQVKNEPVSDSDDDFVENDADTFFQQRNAVNDDEEVLKNKHIKRKKRGRPPKIKPPPITADFSNSELSQKDHIEDQNGVEPFSVQVKNEVVSDSDDDFVENDADRFFEQRSAANDDEKVLKNKHMNRKRRGRPPKKKPPPITADFTFSQLNQEDHIEDHNGVEPFSVQVKNEPVCDSDDEFDENDADSCFQQESASNENGGSTSPSGLSNSAYNSDSSSDKQRKLRNNLTSRQSIELERVYEEPRYLDENRKNELSQRLGLRAAQMPVRLGRRRAKDKTLKNNIHKDCNSDSSSDKQRKLKDNLSSKQLIELERVYKETPFLNASRKKELSQLLGIRAVQIKMWFQGRRAKDKKCGKNIQKENPIESQEVRSEPCVTADDDVSLSLDYQEPCYPTFTISNTFTVVESVDDKRSLMNLVENHRFVEEKGISNISVDSGVSDNFEDVTVKDTSKNLLPQDKKDLSRIPLKNCYVDLTQCEDDIKRYNYSLNLKALLQHQEDVENQQKEQHSPVVHSKNEKKVVLRRRRKRIYTAVKKRQYCKSKVCPKREPKVSKEAKDPPASSQVYVLDTLLTLEGMESDESILSTISFPSIKNTTPLVPTETTESPSQPNLTSFKPLPTRPQDESQLGKSIISENLEAGGKEARAGDKESLEAGDKEKFSVIEDLQPQLAIWDSLITITGSQEAARSVKSKTTVVEENELWFESHLENETAFQSLIVGHLKSSTITGTPEQQQFGKCVELNMCEAENKKSTLEISLNEESCESLPQPTSRKSAVTESQEPTQLEKSIELSPNRTKNVKSVLEIDLNDESGIQFDLWNSEPSTTRKEEEIQSKPPIESSTSVAGKENFQLEKHINENSCQSQSQLVINSTVTETHQKSVDEIKKSETRNERVLLKVDAGKDDAQSQSQLIVCNSNSTIKSKKQKSIELNKTQTRRGRSLSKTQASEDASQSKPQVTSSKSTITGILKQTRRGKLIKLSMNRTRNVKSPLEIELDECASRSHPEIHFNLWDSESTLTIMEKETQILQPSESSPSVAEKEKSQFPKNNSSVTETQKQKSMEEPKKSKAKNERLLLKSYSGKDETRNVKSALDTDLDECASQSQPEIYFDSRGSEPSKEETQILQPVDSSTPVKEKEKSQLEMFANENSCQSQSQLTINNLSVTETQKQKSIDKHQKSGARNKGSALKVHSGEDDAQSQHQLLVCNSKSTLTGAQKQKSIDERNKSQSRRGRSLLKNHTSDDAPQSQPQLTIENSTDTLTGVTNQLDTSVVSTTSGAIRKKVSDLQIFSIEDAHLSKLTKLEKLSDLSNNTSQPDGIDLTKVIGEGVALKSKKQKSIDEPKKSGAGTPNHALSQSKLIVCNSKSTVTGSQKQKSIGEPNKSQEKRGRSLLEIYTCEHTQSQPQLMVCNSNLTITEIQEPARFKKSIVEARNEDILLSEDAPQSQPKPTLGNATDTVSGVINQNSVGSTSGAITKKVSNLQIFPIEGAHSPKASNLGKLSDLYNRLIPREEESLLEIINVTEDTDAQYHLNGSKSDTIDLSKVIDEGIAVVIAEHHFESKETSFSPQQNLLNSISIGSETQDGSQLDTPVVVDLSMAENDESELEIPDKARDNSSKPLTNSVFVVNASQQKIYFNKKIRQHVTAEDEDFRPSKSLVPKFPFKSCDEVETATEEQTSPGFSEPFTSSPSDKSSEIHVSIDAVFKCNICDFETMYVEASRQHQLGHIRSSLVMYECNICPSYRTTNQLRLKRHVKTHNTSSSRKVKRTHRKEDSNADTLNSLETSNHIESNWNDNSTSRVASCEKANPVGKMIIGKNSTDNIRTLNSNLSTGVPSKNQKVKDLYSLHGSSVNHNLRMIGNYENKKRVKTSELDDVIIID